MKTRDIFFKQFSLLSIVISVAYWLVAIGFLSTIFANTGDETVSESVPSTLISFIIDVLTSIVSVIVSISNVLVSVSASAFQITLDYTVGSFADYYEIFGGAVGNIWELVRDIINVLIIALFFAVVIGIIISSERFGDKLTLVKLFIAAVFVNFSAFFIKILIDISNLAIVYFHGNVTGDDSSLAHSFLVWSDKLGTTLEPKKINPEEVDQLTRSLFDLVLELTNLAISVALIYIFFYLAMRLVVRFLVVIFMLAFSPTLVLGYFFKGVGDNILKQLNDLWKRGFAFAFLYFPVLLILLKIPAQIGQKLTEDGPGLDTVVASIHLEQANLIIFSLSVFASIILADYIAKELTLTRSTTFFNNKLFFNSRRAAGRLYQATQNASRIWWNRPGGPGDRWRWRAEKRIEMSEMRKSPPEVPKKPKVPKENATREEREKYDEAMKRYNEEMRYRKLRKIKDEVQTKVRKGYDKGSIRERLFAYKTRMNYRRDTGSQYRERQRRRRDFGGGRKGK